MCHCHGGPSSSIHSLTNNSIGTEGAKALAAAMKTATNLQKLWINAIGREGEDAIRAAAKKTGTEIQ